MAADSHRQIEAVFRIEGPRLIAGLARVTRDVGVAEELAQDALLAALERWPRDGTPANPGAWLMATAKRRAIDGYRRSRIAGEKHQEIGRGLEWEQELAVDRIDAGLDDHVGDDLLGLIFTACHPVLSMDARVALTLRLLGGLTTAEIARAYLAAEPTIAQRIVRAKRALADAGVGFERPARNELHDRLPAALEVIYLIFNEGYAATSGTDWMRPQLCHEALRLGRIVAELVPREPEVHGLVGLMEIQASRLTARVDAEGQPILMADQNRARWDPLLIRRGLAAVARAEALGMLPGPYLLQAEIAACHARARTFADTDWRKIAALYGVLSTVAPSPVVELNRAVAVGMGEGPAAGLAMLDAVAETGALNGYHLLPAVRADLLAKLGRMEDARAEFERAAAMTRNERERALLLHKAAQCAH